MTTTRSAAGRARSVTDASFAFDVLRAPVPVLVDFYADWCGACQRVAPVLDNIARDYDSRLIVAKVDVDKHPAMAERYGVRGVPSLLLFRDGQELWRLVNVVREPAITSKLDETLGAQAPPT